MRKRSGFMMYQLLAVIFIIAVICGYSLINITPVAQSVSHAELEADAGAVAMAITLYRNQMKTYPTTLDALTVRSGIYGPWLNRATPIVDPNGRSYMYVHNANGFAVWSVGPDGANNSGGGGATLPTAISGDDAGHISK